MVSYPDDILESLAELCDPTSMYMCESNYVGCMPLSFQCNGLWNCDYMEDESECEGIQL